MFLQPGFQNKKIYGSSSKPRHQLTAADQLREQTISFGYRSPSKLEVVCSTIVSQQELSNAVPDTTLFQLYLLAFFLLFEWKSGSSYRRSFSLIRPRYLQKYNSGAGSCLNKTYRSTRPIKAPGEIPYTQHQPLYRGY